MQNTLSNETVFSDKALTGSVAAPIQLLLAGLIGVVILYGAVFIETPAVHNAAHDMRHSQAFPCH